jgi:membrane fusion protein, copper/silver efflux system
VRRTAIIAAVMAFGAVAAYGGYRFAMQRMDHASAPAATAESGRKVLYWYDPMYPQQRFDKPGKSPFMDMQLVPKYADEAASDPGAVAISPQVVQNLGVRLTEAKRGRLEQRFEAVGAVAYNERGVVQLQARAAGFVEKLHARAPLDAVKQGQPLIEMLFPEWAGAQEEYLLVRKADAALAQAARQRLLLLGMTEREIATVEREGKAQPRMTLGSPISGVIAELGVREGMTVAPGATLFRIVSLATVWVNAEIPEAQAAWVRPGAPVEARIAGYPGAVFKGLVGAILPEVNTATRTLRARIELANPEGQLKPGMFATLAFSGTAVDAVLVPSEALIRTGSRDVVILALGDGKFRATEVEVGGESGGETAIRKGLQPGDKLVLSGQFLIDSEASLTSTLTRLETPQKPAPQPAAAHKGRGKVLGVSPSDGRIDLTHEPIPSLQWPGMTMGFPVADRTALAAIKPGDTVEFELGAKPNADSEYVIEKLRKLP